MLGIETTRQILPRLILPWMVAAMLIAAPVTRAATFERAGWMADTTPAVTTARSGMVADVINRVSGLTRKQVLELLGDPDERLGPDDLWYLQRDPMFSDHRVLLIQYDDEQIVMRAADVSTETWRAWK